MASGWLPKHRVVVPIDFSEVSFTALDTARGLVEKPERITVVHVLEYRELGLFPYPPDVDQQRRQSATEALRAKLAEHGCESAQIEISEGSPGPTITELAQRLGADLIVITSHGHTGLDRLLLGSVAEKVLRLARCPVLILRQ